MDIYYYLDINHCWTCIIWTYTSNGHILLGHKQLLNIPYYDEHEPCTATRYGLLDSSHCWTFDT